MAGFDLDADVVELAAYVPEAAAAPLREMRFRADAWTPAEYDSLRAMFVADDDVQDIAEAIGRPFHAIRSKICDLGLRRNSHRPWIEWEEAEIAKRYGDDPTADIARDIGRSCGSVYQRAAILGLTEGMEPDYTEWEDAQVRAGYAAGVPIVQIGALIGRTVSSITTRNTKVLKLKHANSPPNWTETECARALELAQGGTLYRVIREQLEAEGFPARSQQAFKQMIRLVGYGRGWGRLWMEDEDELLRRAYAAGESLTPLANRLGRNKGSLSHRAKLLGLHGTHVNKAGWRVDPCWTEEEDALLRESYGKVRGKKLKALFPHRRGGAVYQRAHALDLDGGYNQPVTEDDLRAIHIAYAVGIGLTDLGLAMKRDTAMAHRLAQRMGLKFSDPSRPKAARGLRANRPPPPSLAEILAMPATIPAGPFLPLLQGWRKRGRPPQPKELSHAA